LALKEWLGELRMGRGARGGGGGFVPPAVHVIDGSTGCNTYLLHLKPRAEVAAAVLC